jgi:ABC-2 type transport system ATP-binding protein
MATRARRWRRTLLVPAALALVGVGLAACSSSSATSTSTTSTAATTASTTCRPPADWAATKATPVAGVASDYDLTSFDGTTIRIHWFPDPSAGGKDLPTVLMGPGWGQSGDTDTTSAGIQGALSIAQLWHGGFNVLTWDPRGFGKSSGAAEVDSPAYEGRDVTAIINWLAQQHGVELDRPGVPRIGMVGESYGGGIQFVAASQDCRIDAIAPTIAWHSLGTSLDKNQTPKAGWSNILQSVAATATLDPEINTADKEMNTTGTIDPRATAFFLSRGPAPELAKVKVPTLILQGTVDDLFTLDEGIANYQTLRRQGTTVSMAWFCGGHGVCLTDPGTALEVGPLSLAWMQHYVARDTSVPALSGFAFVDQRGISYAAAQWPLPAGAPVVASGSGTLSLTATGGSGPPHVAANAEAANAVDAVAYGVTPAPATNAVDVTVPLTRAATLVGAPVLSLTYSGTVPAGDRPTRVFAQLVDPATGIVVNNQITPIPVTLDGATHRLVIPLETIAYTASPGTSLELQLVATTVAYVTPRLGGTVHFSHIGVAIPTVRGLTVLHKG